MSKYIVDTDDFEPLFKVDSIGVFGIGKSLSDSDEDHSWSRIKSVEEFEELTADYINEHFGDLQDTAYKKGFEDGKAVNNKGCEGCMYNDGTKEHSPCDICCNAYLNRWTAKQTDEEIKAGDEVIFNNTMKCLVVKPESDEGYAALIDSNGNHHSAENCDCKKTGRHFDIQSILEEMRHD